MILDPPQHSSDVEWETAFNDALRSIASIPNPREALRWLDQALIDALVAAENGRIPVCLMDLHPHLLRAGLVDSIHGSGLARGRDLTAFGMAVRRAAMEREL